MLGRDRSRATLAPLVPGAAAVGLLFAHWLDPQRLVGRQLNGDGAYESIRFVDPRTFPPTTGWAALPPLLVALVVAVPVVALAMAFVAPRLRLAPLGTAALAAAAAVAVLLEEHGRTEATPAGWLAVGALALAAACAVAVGRPPRDRPAAAAPAAAAPG